MAPLRAVVSLLLLSDAWAMDVDLLPFFPGPGIEKGDQNRDKTGRNAYKIVHNGIDRVFETYKPSEIKPKGLLLCIHGWLETSTFACASISGVGRGNQILRRAALLGADSCSGQRKILGLP